MLVLVKKITLLMLALVRSLKLALVRSSSYTPDASFSGAFLIHSSCWFNLVMSFSCTPRAQSVVLARNLSYTPGASFSCVRSFPYTPDASFSEEFPFHSPCLVVLVS